MDTYSTKEGGLMSFSEWKKIEAGDDYDDVEDCIYCLDIITGLDECYHRRMWEDDDSPDDYENEFACIQCVEDNNRRD
jgi:hypothetical protein